MVHRQTSFLLNKTEDRLLNESKLFLLFENSIQASDTYLHYKSVRNENRDEKK